MKKMINRLINFIDGHEKVYLVALLGYFFIRGITFEETWFTLLPVSTFVFLIIEVIRTYKISADIRELLIVLSLLSFYLFWGEYLIMGMGLIAMCLAFFVLAKYLAINHSQNDYLVENVLIVFSFGVVCLGVLEYIPFFANLISGGEWTEEWPAFWRHDLVRRTNFDLYFAPMSGMIMYGLYKVFKKEIKGIVVLLVSLLAVLIPCFSQGRMVLCASALTIVVLLLYLIIKERKQPLVARTILIILSVILMLGVLAELAVSFDWLGIGTAFKNSWLNGSMGLVHNIRFNMKPDQLKLLPKFPWGRCTVPLQYPFYNNLPYDDPHDLWLFVARKGGVIPFVLFVSFSGLITIDLIKLWRCDSVSMGQLLCVTGVFYVVNLYCWCESVIEGRPYMWAFVCFVSGIIRGLNLRYEYE